LQREAEDTAEEKAQMVILTAMERMASDVTSERTVTAVELTDEDMKGSIQRSVFIPTALHEDSRGDIWIGTVSNGLLCYTPSTGKLRSVLGSPCLDISSIEEDEQGHLWVSTLYGLGKYDRSVGTFTNYFAADGIGGNQFYDRASCRLPDGTMLFGGTHGLTFFNPLDVPAKRHVPLLFEDLKEEDVEMVVLPGGLPGATNLDAHAGLDKLIMSFAAAGKPLAAICAAPMVYGKRGLLKGKKATCYPGFDKYLEGAEYTGNMVEVVDNFILGKGPGAAPAFAFAILEKYAGAEKALEVKKGMLLA
jgi:4-methyl-5(b-hydroxyethyl)-thiazole monophosphate biosynthesis